MTKKIALIVMALAVFAFGQNVPIYFSQGGTQLTIGTGGSLVVGPGVLKFTKTDTVPSSPAEGWSYWDDSENMLKLYTGSAWVALATTAGAGTLDNAYDSGSAGGGRAIAATDGAVTIGNTEADTTNILEISKSPSAPAAGAGILVTNGANATGAGISFANSGSGADILGTSSTWSVSKAGAGLLASLELTGSILFEGTTADANELTLAVADPGADVTVTLPARTGTAVLETVSITPKTQADTPFAVTAALAGQVVTNAGAVGGLVCNLPEASTVIGRRFTFCTMAGQTFDMNPDDADVILGLTNAAGDSIRNSTAGNSVTLLAIDATNWVAVGIYGTWADNN